MEKWLFRLAAPVLVITGVIILPGCWLLFPKTIQQAALRLEMNFAGLDTNHDHVLTFEEAASGSFFLSRETFNLLDADKDGRLTLQELRAITNPGGEGEGEGEVEGEVAPPGPIVFVDAAAAGAADGRSWSTAFHTVQTALDAAAGHETEVWVAHGVYAEQRDNDTGSIILPEGVEVYGGFIGTETDRAQRDWETHETVLDGSMALGERAAYHVVVAAEHCVLDGFTIRGGLADGGGVMSHGGGFYASSFDGALANCIFEENAARGENGCNAIQPYLELPNPCPEGFTSGGHGGDGLGGGVYVEAGQARIESCTFSGNNTAGGGGGSPRESSGGSGGRGGNALGGAIYLGSGIHSVRSCSFEQNIATGAIGGGGHPDDMTGPGSNGQGAGGAVYSISESLVVEGCTFSGNIARSTDGYGHGDGLGGALYASGATTLQQCTFQSNIAQGSRWYFNYDLSMGAGTSSGGAIFSQASLDIHNCRFLGNTASGSQGGGDAYGGAISASADADISNSIFYRNEALGGDARDCGCEWAHVGLPAGGSAFGGSVFAQQGTVTLTNCSFAEANAVLGEDDLPPEEKFSIASGGHLFLAQESVLTATNSILWNATPEPLAAQETAQVDISYSDIQGGWTGNGNLESDPLFVNAAEGDLHLLSGSPCIDAGNSDGAPETDAEDRSRVDDAGTANTGVGPISFVDIGAFEHPGGSGE